MFQSFTVTTSPETGAERLSNLRQVMRDEQVDGFLVPRADAHFGENVAVNSERLAWLTGFTGSAGFCAALLEKAGAFVDGRYTLQVRTQVDLDHFTPVPMHEVKLADWLIETMPDGGTIAYDPWLHSFDEIEKLEVAVGDHKITLRKTDNFVDRIWEDRPTSPKGRIQPHALEFAGETSESKREKVGSHLTEKDLSAAVLTLPDSIAWLLNIRGSDIFRTPVALCFAILHADGKVDLFVDPDKCDDALRSHLGEDVSMYPEEEFAGALAKLDGNIGVDRATAPIIISDKLQNPVWEDDPCILPKACKNPTEIEGSRTATSVTVQQWPNSCAGWKVPHLTGI